MTTVEDGYYFGRFQPPLIKHGEIAREITKTYPGMRLIVGTANSSLPLTQQNFLTGPEVRYLMQKTLWDLGLKYIPVKMVEIYTDRSLEDSLREFFRNRQSPTLVFSGSPSTATACEAIAQEYHLTVVHLSDDDKTGPRARHVRSGLINGENGWTDLVTPSVLNYLAGNGMVERIKSLPDGQKRPWAKPHS